MKRTFSVMLPIIIMVLVAVICICLYLFGTNQIKFNNHTLNTAEISNVVSSDEENVILAKNELPRLDASVITQPLMTALIRDFTCDDSIQESSLNYSDTEEALKKLLKDEVDVVICPYPSEDILSLADIQGIELDIIPIAKEGFVFFVNSNNVIDNIKVSDIQKIYIGEISNWSQIGGDNAEIKAFQKPEGSIAQREMNRTVMKGLQMAEAPRSIFVDKTFGKITDLIANYDNSENAIGYSYYNEAKRLYDFDAKIDNTVKLLKINDIEPNYSNIKDNSYPLITHYYLIKNKNNQSEHLKIFSEAVLSERAKGVIKGAGYIDE